MQTAGHASSYLGERSFRLYCGHQQRRVDSQLICITVGLFAGCIAEQAEQLDFLFLRISQRCDRILDACQRGSQQSVALLNDIPVRQFERHQSHAQAGTCRFALCIQKSVQIEVFGAVRTLFYKLDQVDSRQVAHAVRVQQDFGARIEAFRIRTAAVGFLQIDEARFALQLHHREYEMQELAARHLVERDRVVGHAAVIQTETAVAHLLDVVKPGRLFVAEQLSHFLVMGDLLLCPEAVDAVFGKQALIVIVVEQEDLCRTANAAHNDVCADQIADIEDVDRANLAVAFLVDFDRIKGSVNLVFQHLVDAFEHFAKRFMAAGSSAKTLQALAFWPYAVIGNLDSMNLLICRVGQNMQIVAERFDPAFLAVANVNFGVSVPQHLQLGALQSLMHRQRLVLGRKQSDIRPDRSQAFSHLLCALEAHSCSHQQQVKEVAQIFPGFDVQEGAVEIGQRIQIGYAIFRAANPKCASGQELLQVEHVVKQTLGLCLQFTQIRGESDFNHMLVSQLHIVVDRTTAGFFPRLASAELRDKPGVGAIVDKLPQRVHM